LSNSSRCSQKRRGSNFSRGSIGGNSVLSDGGNGLGITIPSPADSVRSISP
jgi:hypothetical protein